MANFRTTEESLFNALPSGYSDSLLQNYFEEREEVINRRISKYSYALNNSEKKFLSGLGINLSPFQTESHPHPVSKTIENWILFEIIPNSIDALKPFIIFSCKEEKTKYLFNRRIKKNGKKEVINKVFEVKDACRFHGQSVIHFGTKQMDLFFAKVRQRVGGLSNDSCFFFHDEIHHWKLESFAQMLTVCNPEMVIFTAIYPAELLDGISFSLNSIAYNFSVSGDDFFFFPDGKGSDPYHQKVSNNWFMNTGKISIKVKRDGTSCNVVYSLSKISTLGAHHVFVCRRGDLQTESVRFYKDYDCTNPSNIAGIFSSRNALSGHHLKVRTWILEKIMSYLVCLKKPDIESALAKLRQLSEFDLSLGEARIITGVSEVLNKYGIKDSISFGDFLCHPLSTLAHEFGVKGSILEPFFSKNSFYQRLLLKDLFSDELQYSKSIVVQEQSISFNNYSSLFGKIIGEKKLHDRLSKIKDVKKGLACVMEDCKPRNASPKGVEEKKVEATEEFKNHQEESSGIDLNEDYLSNPAFVSFSNRRNACFFSSLANEMGMTMEYVMDYVLRNRGLREKNKEALSKTLMDHPLTVDDISDICIACGWRVALHMGSDVIRFNDDKDLVQRNLGGRPGHIFNISETKNKSAELLEEIKRIYASTYGCSAPENKFKKMEYKRAKELLKSFQTMNFGGLIDRSKIKKGELVSSKMLELIKSDDLNVDQLQDLIEYNIVPFVGFAGSGKSYRLTQGLIDGHNIGNFLMISPRRVILDQVLKRKDELSEEERVSLGSSFKTFESALLSRLDNKLIFLDETSLLPPGYLDLLALKKISESTEAMNFLSGNTSKCQKIRIDVAVTGDPLQGMFHSERAQSLNSMQNELSNILFGFERKEVCYLLGTRRFGEPNQPFINLPFYGEGNMDVGLFKNLNFLDVDSYREQIKDRKIVALVASQSDKAYLSQSPLDVLTIGESQGSTFAFTVLYITPDFFKISDENLMVALTRHRKGLFMVVDEERDFMSNPHILRHRFMSVINKDFSKVDEYINDRIKGFKVVEKVPFGHDFEIKLEGDPFLKASLFMNEEVKLEDILLQKNEAPEPVIKTHISLCHSNPLEKEISEKMRSKESREFVVDRDVSNQFKDTFGPREENKTSQCWSAEAVFPKHSNSDSVTFWAAVKKRLVFSDPRKNLSAFKSNKGKGKRMLKEFLKHVPLRPEFNQVLYDESVSEFERKKVSKPASTIENHHARSLKDWRENEIFLFMKSQLCTKAEKMFSDAKAGQTLACFSHELLIKFAPMARYIERKVSEALPENLYIHQKKNFDSLEDWVIKNDFSNVCTESDYEAFDRSQDSCTLAFEVELMRHLNISENLIQDYIWLKCNLDSKIGTLAIMRFTGEFGTFLFNTLTNMVYTFMQYKVAAGTSICFAGDDMCANRRLSLRTDNKDFFSSFSLKAKVDFVKNPMFCGWMLSSHGIVKNPKLIEARLQVAKEKGNLHLVMDSYFLEYCYSFKKGDHLMEILTDELLGYHYTLTRFFVQNKNKLSGEAREVLESSRIDGALVFGEMSFGSHSNIPGFLSLGHKLGGLISIACQSSMQKDFCQKLQGKGNPCSLTQSSPKISTVISMFSQSQSTGRSGSFNIPYLSQQREEMERFAQRYHASIVQKSNTSKVEQMSMGWSTWERFSSASLACLNYESQLRANSYSLMQGFLTQSKPYRAHLISQLVEGRRISSTFLTTQYQSMTQTSIYAVGSSFPLKACLWLKGHLLSIWISVSSIDSQIRWIAGSLKTWLEKSIVKSCLGPRECCGMMTKLLRKLMKWMRITMLCFLRTMRFSVEVCCLALRGLIKGNLILKESLMLEYQQEDYEGNLVEEAGWRLDGTASMTFLEKNQKLFTEITMLISTMIGHTLNFTMSCLGQLRTNLIHLEDLLDNRMSIVKLQQDQIRLGVEEQLWALITTTNNLGLIATEGHELTDVQRTQRRAILNHYMDYVAGNIAILGTSREVNYPGIPLQIPVPRVNGIEIPADFSPEITLEGFVNTVEAWASVHVSEHIRNATRRQLFEPTALHAMHFLQADPENRVTNIASKRCYQCRKAPEVAFDFNGGLPRRVINDTRAQVISALNSTLFRVEGQKGIFEAKGTVELNFDG